MSVISYLAPIFHKDQMFEESSLNRKFGAAKRKSVRLEQKRAENALSPVSSPTPDSIPLEPNAGSRIADYHDRSRIHTPDWVMQSRPETPKFISDAACKTINTDIHHELEVIEIRIGVGHYEHYKHPGYSASIQKQETDFVMTRGEKKLRKNYDNSDPMQQVPSFWTPRVWDSQATRMSEYHSKKLQERVSFFSYDPENGLSKKRYCTAFKEEGEFVNIDNVDLLYSFDEEPKKRGRPKKTANEEAFSKFLIKLPEVSCQTDDSDDLTENEFY